MPDHPRIDVGECNANGIQVGEHNNRCKRDEYPRPWPDRIMRDLKQKNGTNGVALTTRGQHSLRNVTTATRLRTRLPDTPPLHGKGDNEDGQCHLHVREVRNKTELRCYVGMGEQILQAINLRQTQRYGSRKDRARH